MICWHTLAFDLLLSQATSISCCMGPSATQDMLARGRDSMSKVGGLGVHKVGGYLNSF